MNTTSPIRGLVPPVPTPFRPDGSPDGDAWHRIARHLHDGGVDAAFVLGSTGELASLSHALRRQAVTAAARAFDGLLPLVVGIGDPCLEESLSLAEHAASEGAAAVVLNAPSYYEISGREMRRYLDAIMPRLPLPVMLYNMPWLTGHHFDRDTIRHAVGFEGLAGFKDSSGDLGTFAEIVEVAAERPELAVLIGNDFLFLESLRRGGHGAVAGGCTLHPHLFRGLLDAHAAGDDARAGELQGIIAALGRGIFDLTGEPGSVFATIKGGLASLGLCRAEMLPPLTGCGEQMIHRIRSQMENAGLAEAVA